MDIKAVENILGVSYKPDEAFCNRGKCFQFLANLALREIRKEVADGNSVLFGVERLSESIGLECKARYQSKFKRLVKDYKKENPSFIFYGDHQFMLEPLLYLLGIG